jgi:hypothetical protein
MKLKCGGTDVTSKTLASMRSVAVAAFAVLESAWALHNVVLVDFKVYQSGEKMVHPKKKGK